MSIEIVVSLGITLWTCLTLLIVSLCRAAKWSDDAMDQLLVSDIAAGPGAEVTRPPSAQRSLRTLSLHDAARLLEVNPHTLLAWEARFGFPASSPAEACYSQSEVLALRDSLEHEASVASAVVHARSHGKRRRTAAASGQRAS
jgi:hypothetical protein